MNTNKMPLDALADLHGLDEVTQLVAAYAASVRARRAVGDARAEYHAQRPKIEAHKILLAAGKTPKEAVAHFRALLAKHCTDVTE